jgi:hypothetical protein
VHRLGRKRGWRWERVRLGLGRIHGRNEWRGQVHKLGPVHRRVPVQKLGVLPVGPVRRRAVVITRRGRMRGGIDRERGRALAPALAAPGRILGRPGRRHSRRGWMHGWRGL